MLGKGTRTPEPFVLRKGQTPARIAPVCSTSESRDFRQHRTAADRLKQGLQTVQKAAAALPILLAAGPAQATAAFGDGSVGVAVGGGLFVAALSATLLATDPAQRRKKQKADSGGDEKKAVASYFNTQGFERWRKIYGETDDVNKVQLDIRQGHAQTVDKVLNWLSESALKGVSVCDAGCGTGSLAIPLALRGASVNASDISSSMANEGQRRYEEAVSQGGTRPQSAPTFSTSDLESLTGSYDVVTCLDVMIHYPQEEADGMISHLASLSKDKLIISFAPKTLQYTILKRIGELFPGPAKATRAYLHKEADIEKALQRAGFRVKRRDLTATSFYFSLLMEAERR